MNPDPANPEPVIRQLSTRVVYRNRWLSVREDRIQRPDGSEGIYGLIERADFVVVIPAEHGGFHLVQEYRYPIGRRTWSFPQGAAPDPSRPMAPDRLARAELAEETGLRARTLTRLGFLHSAHGTIDNGFTAYLATGLEPGEPAREHEEQDMAHAFVNRTRFELMIAERLITDAATLAAYGLLLMRERAAAAEAAAA